MKGIAALAGVVLLAYVLLIPTAKAASELLGVVLWGPVPLLKLACAADVGISVLLLSVLFAPVLAVVLSADAGEL